MRREAPLSRQRIMDATGCLSTMAHFFRMSRLLLAAKSFLLVAARHGFGAGWLGAGGRACTVVRPPLRGRMATEARACDRASAATNEMSCSGDDVPCGNGGKACCRKTVSQFFASLCRKNMGFPCRCACFWACCTFNVYKKTNFASSTRDAAWKSTLPALVF